MNRNDKHLSNRLPLSSKGDGFPYYHPGRFIRTFFGERLFRIPVDAGFSCPNRDGSINNGGCIFCQIDGFRPYNAQPSCSLAQQVQQALPDCQRRHPKAKHYLIYLQSFTNTFCSPAALAAVADEALACPGMRGIVIATRPDCLPCAILDQLDLIKARTFLQVEVGVQSTCDTTLAAMNRGHTWADSRRALIDLRQRRIRTAAHMILGTPWEPVTSQIHGASLISDLNISAVKIHHLQVLHGSPLSSPGLIDHYQLPGMSEYIDLVVDFLSHLDRGIVVERLMSEAPHRLLIAPRWNQKSRDVRALIVRKMTERNCPQGCAYHTSRKIENGERK